MMPILAAIKGFDKSKIREIISTDHNDGAELTTEYLKSNILPAFHQSNLLLMFFTFKNIFD
jgi:hypothetical protein